MESLLACILLRKFSDKPVYAHVVTYPKRLLIVHHKSSLTQEARPGVELGVERAIRCVLGQFFLL